MLPAMSCQSLKPNAREKDENESCARLGISGPTTNFDQILTSHPSNGCTYRCLSIEGLKVGMDVAIGTIH